MTPDSNGWNRLTAVPHHLSGRFQPTHTCFRRSDAGLARRDAARQPAHPRRGASCGPSSGGRYGIESKFTRAVRDLVGRFEHRLFLSATPHNGHSNSFSTLLELLDPYRFTRGVKVRGRKALEDVMVRRLKEDIRATQGGFPERRVERVVIDGLAPDAPELELSRLLDEYRTAREERHAHTSSRVQAAAGLLVVGLQQRLLSSVEAFRAQPGGPSANRRASPGTGAGGQRPREGARFDRCHGTGE